MSTAIQLIDKIHGKKRDFNRCKAGSATIVENDNKLFIKYLEPGSLKPVFRTISIFDVSRLQTVYEDLCSVKLQFTQEHGRSILNSMPA